MREVRNKDDHSKVEGGERWWQETASERQSLTCGGTNLKHSTWEAEIE